MNSFPSETNDEFAKEIKPIQLALELSTAVDDIVNNSVDLAFNELKVYKSDFLPPCSKNI